MPCFPVVERELRVAARRRLTYRVRFFAVLLLLGVFAWNLNQNRYEHLANTQQGKDLFNTLSFFAFVYAALIGIMVTSDCVSEEKREGTLGLLFLTDLKGYDVIYGKLAGNSLNAFYGLVAILPIIGIPLLLGGVSLLQFAKVAVALLATIFLSLATGIFVSTHSRNDRKAMFYTFVLMLAFVVVPFVTAWWLLEGIHALKQAELWLGLMFSPGFAIGIAMEGSRPTWAANSFWYSIGWTLFYALILLTSASRRIPHSWNELDKPSTIERKIPEPLVKIQRGTAPRSLLNINPFLWLAMRGETHPKVVMSFALAMIFIWLIGFVRFGLFMFDPGVFFPTVVFVHTFLKFWIVAEASRRFGEDRRGSGFELILSTPLDEKAIIHGQWMALRKQFLPAIILLIIWEALAQFIYMSDRQRAQQIATMIFLAMDFVALSWAGMWLGLTCKSRGRAIILGLGQVLVLPFVMTRFAMMITNYPPRNLDETIGTILGFIVCAGANLVILFRARANLHQKFRLLATQRFERAAD